MQVVESCSQLLAAFGVVLFTVLTVATIGPCRWGSVIRTREVEGRRASRILR